MGLFDFFYGKSLDKEVNKMIGQCDGFLLYAIGLSEEAKKELLPSLKDKREVLDEIMMTYKSKKGKLDGQSFLALKELKKQCTKMYNDNFNYMGKSFDEEYMPVKFKV